VVEKCPQIILKFSKKLILKFYFDLLGLVKLHPRWDQAIKAHRAVTACYYNARSLTDFYMCIINPLSSNFLWISFLRQRSSALMLLCVWSNVQLVCSIIVFVVCEFFYICISEWCTVSTTRDELLLFPLKNTTVCCVFSHTIVSVCLLTCSWNSRAHDGWCLLALYCSFIELILSSFPASLTYLFARCAVSLVDVLLYGRSGRICAFCVRNVHV